MRVLVTGFGAFGSVTDNPSAALARQSGERSEVLIVAYEEADRFVSTLDADSFDAWLMLGVASNRSKVSIELKGRNFRSGADVADFNPSGAIDPEKAPWLPATLWTPSLIDSLLGQFPEEVDTSDDAGTYLCNYLTFLGLSRFPRRRIGFLHVVPFTVIPEQKQAEIVEATLSQIRQE